VGNILYADAAVAAFCSPFAGILMKPQMLLSLTFTLAPVRRDSARKTADFVFVLLVARAKIFIAIF